MADLEQARELLKGGGFSCVLCKDETILTSELRGVRFLMEQYRAGTDLTGFSAADKIVGKASALLLTLMGVNAVHARVISESAIDVLKRRGIFCSYDMLVAYISNQAGTGLCPMEQAVRTIEDPSEAPTAIALAIQRMQKSNQDR